MKRCLGVLLALFLFSAVPLLTAQVQDMDHVEVGAFADYFRFSDPGPNTANFFGLGGRAGFGVSRNVQIEAEMAYDFERNYTTTFNNGVTTANVISRFRALHGFFGPKFQTGSGPFRFFVTAKVGFENFSFTNQGAPTGFVSAVGLGTNTYLGLYPGGGIEAFAGPFGVRAEVGDNIFINNGAHNNLRITFGPQFRF